MIALREKIVSVAKRYEKQATAQKKVAAAPAKSIEPVSKNSNHDFQAQGLGKGKSKSKGKRGK
jgi:rubrerythrin